MTRACRLLGAFLCTFLLLVSCSGSRPDTADGDTDIEPANEEESSNTPQDGDSPPDGDHDETDREDERIGDDDKPSPIAFTVVTVNTGTSEGMGHDSPPDDGYTSAHAALSDQYYGDGLAWTPAVEAARRFFARLDPDIVVFQEIFFSDECADIPETAHSDFVCETWSPGDPTVAQVILGENWQVMCHLGKPDKCAAVNRRFGVFRGCNQDFCLEGMDGFRVEGCGGGSRIGRGVIDLVSGGTLTLVNVHGSSGIKTSDQECRVRQINQVFVDFGDGAPAANGERNLIMGDMNTDPGRMATADPSAARWNDFVGPDHAFRFLSAVGPDAPPTYAGIFNIDHVVSDILEGTCWVAGVTEGHPPVTEAKYFDHKPVVCEVRMESH